MLELGISLILQGFEMEKNSISAETFDAITRNDAVLWGAKAIGDRIGRSPEYVRRTLAKLPDSPIKTVGRELCVGERRLLEFVGA